MQSRTALARPALFRNAALLLGSLPLAGLVRSRVEAANQRVAMVDPAARKAGVTVIARLTAKPGMESQVRDIFMALALHARGEAGNLSYDLVESIDDPATFASIESWTSGEALQVHLKTSTVQDAIVKIGPLLASAPSIVTFRMLTDPV